VKQETLVIKDKGMKYNIHSANKQCYQLPIRNTCRWGDVCSCNLCRGLAIKMGRVAKVLRKARFEAEDSSRGLLGSDITSGWLCSVVIN